MVELKKILGFETRTCFISYDNKIKLEQQIIAWGLCLRSCKSINENDNDINITEEVILPLVWDEYLSCVTPWTGGEGYKLIFPT